MINQLVILVLVLIVLRMFIEMLTQVSLTHLLQRQLNFLLMSMFIMELDKSILLLKNALQIVLVVMDISLLNVSLVLMQQDQQLSLTH